APGMTRDGYDRAMYYIGIWRALKSNNGRLYKSLADRGRHGTKIVVQKIDGSGSRQLLADRRETRDIREEQGDDLPLGKIDAIGRGRDQAGHDARIHELTEGVFYSLLSADFLDHMIKRDRELPDLVICFDGDGSPKMSGLNRCCAFGQTA